MFGFTIVTVLIIALGLYLLGVFNTININTEQIKNENLPRLIANEQITISLSNMVGSARAFVLSGDKSNREKFDEYKEISSENVDLLNKFATSKEFTELIDNTKQWQDFIELEVFAEYDKGNEDLAIENLLKADSFVPSLINKFEDRASRQETEIIQSEDEIYAYGKTTIYVAIGIIILVVILSSISGLVTANSISRPIRSIMERMNLIAKGDLTSEPLISKSRDEVSRLIIATNEMTEKTRDLLVQINNVSDTVTGQSEELTQSANEVTAGTEQIAVTMEELATGSESQANNASDLSSTMNEFAEKVDEASMNGGHIQRSSKEVIEMTNNGNELMDASAKQMGMIDQIVQDAVNKVEGLDKHSQKISELVLVIQDIAEQTNLLALNAAIEAARAGEQGKGFAVVADEVRKLAEQSSDSVTNITGIVNQIQSESSLVVSSLRSGYKEVEEGTTQIITTSETFEHISSAVFDMGERINLVSDNLTEIALSSVTMGRSVEEIAAISEESAAGIEETSASSQQANSSMEEIAASSHDLAKLAEELNSLVQRFKL